MDDPIPEYVPQPVPLSQQASSRRYACDRCRGHKLRCNRNLASLTITPCNRCIKAKAECTITASFRPRKGAAIDQAQETSTSTQSSATLPHPNEALRQTPVLNEIRSLDMEIFPENGSGNYPVDVNSGDSDYTGPSTDQLQEDLGYIDELGRSMFDHEYSQEFDQFLTAPVDSHFRSFASIQNNSHPLNRSQTSILRSSVPEHMLSGPKISTNKSSISRLGEGVSSITINSCIQKLAVLNTGLMKNMKSLSKCKYVTSFLFTASNKDVAEYLFNNLDGTTAKYNSAGEMLQDAETFLETVQELKQILASGQPTSNGLEKNVDSDDSPKIPDHASESSREELMYNRWTTIQSYLSRAKAPGVSTPFSIESDNSMATTQKTKLDTPSILIIINCYICILKIFEAAFTGILYSLEFPPSANIFKELPNATALQIDGFSLKDRNLQIKIVVQVSTHMLDLIEQTLELDLGNEGKHGIIAGSMFRMLLRMVLEEEGLSVSEENLSGMRSVRDLIKRTDEKLE